MIAKKGLLVNPGYRVTEVLNFRLFLNLPPPPAPTKLHCIISLKRTYYGPLGDGYHDGRWDRYVTTNVMCYVYVM